MEHSPFDFGGRAAFRLSVDRCQSDPFAPPTRMHVVLSGAVAGFPPESYSTPSRAVALADYLARMFVHAAKAAGDDQRVESGGWQGKKGGEITMEPPGQHVLARTNVMIDVRGGGGVEARFTVALPARGRSIEGQWCSKILLERLPDLVARSLLFSSLDAAHLRAHILSVEDQDVLRSLLPAAGLVGFVRNGAILPRKSGHLDLPMDAATALPFKSPPSLEREVALPNAGKIRGMGVPKGITLIVGGGFHGKSTLLQALELGVYNHIPGDGREFVCVNPTAVKVRAEDGRAVTQVNITPFIDNLPFGKPTDSFSTADASGSTSQAANIVEALEVGSDCLLMDEDTCATNFMIRDFRMQLLVSRDKEPITPFLAKVQALYNQQGVSSLLVIGGAGDYFDVATTVIMMDNYEPLDKTAEAKAIAAQYSSNAGSSFFAAHFGTLSRRFPIPASLQTEGKVVARGRNKLQYGEEDVDLGGVEQLVEIGQTRAIGFAFQALAKLGSKPTSVRECVEAMECWMEGGLDGLVGGGQGRIEAGKAQAVGDLAKPRRFEIAAALNRFRSLQAKSEVVRP